MPNLEKIKEKILEDIGEKRFKHSLRVADTAKSLAKIHGADENKAYLAGLIHDCSKYNEKSYSEKLNIDPKNYGLKSYKDPVFHSFLGRDVAKKVYNISDEDILKAIAYHTTGRPNMSLLEKIIFVADAVEPKRDFEGLDKLRALSKTDIDQAVLALLNNNIIYLIGKSLAINPLTIDARNFLIEEKNE